MVDEPKLISDLQSPNKAVRMYSVRRLAQQEAGAISTIRELVNLSNDPDEDVASLALRALVLMGADLHSFKSQISEHLKNSSATVRGMAAFAIGSMGTAASDMLPALAVMLGDESPTVQMHAMLAIRKMTDGLLSSSQLIAPQNGTRPVVAVCSSGPQLGLAHGSTHSD
jgi:HEAT repeat protein